MEDGEAMTDGGAGALRRELGLVDVFAVVYVLGTTVMVGVVPVASLVGNLAPVGPSWSLPS